MGGMNKEIIHPKWVEKHHNAKPLKDMYECSGFMFRFSVRPPLTHWTPILGWEA
jgi:hypothetical protein